MITEIESTPPVVQSETTSFTNDQLSRLFGTDLEFLQQSGSLDLFYFDLGTGYDG